MPSDKALTNIITGAGKLHSNVASAASDLQTSSGASSLLATTIAALQQETPVITRTSPVAGTGQTSVVISGATNPIWMGDGSISVEYEDYFRLVTDPYQDVPTEADGSPVYITSLVGAALGDGWFTGSLTVNFSGPITGGFWTVYYGTRATLQSIGTPLEPMTYTSIRNTAHVQQNLANVLRDLHVGSGSRDWDGVWLSTIEDLVKGGLNERYRLSTSGLGGATEDTPGEGAIIFRDGQAVTVQSQATQSLISGTGDTADPYSANFKVLAGPPGTTSSNIEDYDGGTGYVTVLQQRLASSPLWKTNSAALSLASRVDVIERLIRTSTIGTANVRTKVTADDPTGTLLNPDAGTGYNDVRTIQLATGDYFWESVSGNKNSEVAVGCDMLEITFPSGDIQVFVITELDVSDSQRALLMNLSGGGGAFPSGVATTGASFRFVKTKYWQGCGNQQWIRDESGVTPAILLGHLYHAVAPFVTDDVTQSGESEEIGTAEFFARAQTLGNTGVAGITDVAACHALRWGGYNPQTWANEPKGTLRGDGAIETSLVNLTTRKETYTTAGSYTIDWHPALDGSLLIIVMEHTTGVVAITLNVVADYYTNVVQEGDQIEIHVLNSANAPTPGAAAGTGATYTIAWHGIFSFNGNSQYPIQYNTTGRRTAQIWRATFSELGGGDFLMHDEVTEIGAGD
jgi:hypothetical protein